MKYFDYVVVGAGLAGCILARKLAEEQGKQILVLERRNHIAGNLYDETDALGIRVQKYGPHVFHTNHPEVYDFICRYCEPLPFRTKCETVIDGVNTPSPFNFRTVDQFFGDRAENLKNRLTLYYGKRQEVPITEMMKSEDEEIRNYAEFLFHKDYKLYTAKQWNLPPEEIDPSVLKRVPVVLSYRDTYFGDAYEWMPKDGFSAFCGKLLDHPNITVKLNQNALNHIRPDEGQKLISMDGFPVNVIYTGAIDELFGYRYGELPYRSLHFEFCSYPKDSFQNVAVVAYPQAEGYTRTTEFTKMPMQDGHGWTSVAFEYPVPYRRDGGKGSEPYYPVLTAGSVRQYEKYRGYAGQFANLTLCGRLAEFRYYNMDQVVLRALEVYEGFGESHGSAV